MLAGAKGHAERRDELVAVDLGVDLAVLRLEHAAFPVGGVNRHDHFRHFLPAHVGDGEPGGIALDQPCHEDGSAILGPDLHNRFRDQLEVLPRFLQESLNGRRLRQQIHELHEAALGVVLVRQIRLDHLELGQSIELVAEAVSRGQHAGAIKRDLDRAAHERHGGAILIGPGFRGPEGDFRGLLLLDGIRSAEEHVDPAAVGLRPGTSRRLELGIDLRHQLLVLDLVLVHGGVQVGVAAGPEDLLELGRVGVVLETLVGLFFLGQDDGPHFVDPLLGVLVDVRKGIRGKKGDQGRGQTNAFHGAVPLNNRGTKAGAGGSVAPGKQNLGPGGS